MKLALAFLLLIPALSLAGCSEQVQNNDAAPVADASPQAVPASSKPAADVWQGTILETMNSGGYSYVKFNKDGEDIWVAGPESAGLEVGQEVEMAPGMMMSNFHAKSLNRDFAEIYFVGALSAEGQSPDPAANPHGGMGGMGMGGMSAPAGGGGTAGGTSTVLEDAKVDAVLKATGGYTVAGIHEQAKSMGGQTVAVRGRVVKFSPNIMRTNWIHVQDGTCAGSTCDLTVTSSAMVSVGDVVLIEGTLTLDKDFGAGYFYPVIIEGATVTKE